MYMVIGTGMKLGIGDGETIQVQGSAMTLSVLRALTWASSSATRSSVDCICCFRFWRYFF